MCILAGNKTAKAYHEEKEESKKIHFDENGRRSTQTIEQENEKKNGKKNE